MAAGWDHRTGGNPRCLLPRLVRVRPAVGPGARLPEDGRRRAVLRARVPRRLPRRLLQHRDRAGRRPVCEGPRAVRDHLRVRGRRDRVSRPEAAAVLLVRGRRPLRRDRAQRDLRRRPARLRRDWPQPGSVAARPAARGRAAHQLLRSRPGGRRLPAERAHERPQPPRHRPPRAAAPPRAALHATRAQASAQAAARPAPALPSPR